MVDGAGVCVGIDVGHEDGIDVGTEDGCEVGLEVDGQEVGLPVGNPVSITTSVAA